MALQEEFEQQGNFLFRYRGSLPIFILLAAFAVHAYNNYTYGSTSAGEFGRYYELFCFLVALFGQAIRVITVGFTPKNTSGRNTKKQVADEVNTKGIYSIVRHPLYVGNFFMWFGLALLPQDAWFAVAFIFAYWVYYERIMFAEEQFLRRKFGETYTKWAENTPAFIPKIGKWTSPELEFSWKKVIKKEKNGLFALVLLMYVFELVSALVTRQTYIIDNNYWIYGTVASGLFYIVVRTLKYKTNILKEDR